MAARRTLRDDLPVSTHCFFTNTDRQTGLLFLKDAKEGRKKTCLDPAICRDYQITRKTTFAFHGRLSRGESHRSLHRKHSIHKERLYIKLTRVEKTPLLSTLQEQQGRLSQMNSWLTGPFLWKLSPLQVVSPRDAGPAMRTVLSGWYLTLDWDAVL